MMLVERKKIKTRCVHGKTEGEKIRHASCVFGRFNVAHLHCRISIFLIPLINTDYTM